MTQDHPKISPFFSDVNQVNEEGFGFKTFLCDPRDGQILVRSFGSCYKLRMYFGRGMWGCFYNVSFFWGERTGGPVERLSSI